MSDPNEMESVKKKKKELSITRSQRLKEAESKFLAVYPQHKLSVGVTNWLLIVTMKSKRNITVS